MTDKDNNNSNFTDIWLKLEAEIAKQILACEDNEKTVLELGKKNWSSNITTCEMIKASLEEGLKEIKGKNKNEEKKIKDQFNAVEKIFKISIERKKWTAKRWIDWAKIKKKEK
jgi:hypothetical protein